MNNRRRVCGGSTLLNECIEWENSQVNQDSIVTHKKGVNNSLELQDLSNNSELLICYFFMNRYSLITKENS